MNKINKTWENVELYTPAKRGYGECTRLYDNNTSKAIDFGAGYNEYQHSVSAVDGDFEKIVELLDTQPQKKIQLIMDLCATTDPSSIFELWTVKRLGEMIEGVNYVFPEDIYRTYENALENIEVREQFITAFKAIINGETAFSKLYHCYNSHYKNYNNDSTSTLVKLLIAVYPNDKIIEIAKFFEDIYKHEYKKKYYTNAEYNAIPRCKVSYERTTINGETYIQEMTEFAEDVEPIGEVGIFGKVVAIKPISKEE